MKMRCIDDSDCTHILTSGKIYDVEKSEIGGDYVFLRNDRGLSTDFYKYRFKELEMTKIYVFYEDSKINLMACVRKTISFSPLNVNLTDFLLAYDAYPYEVHHIEHNKEERVEIIKKIV